MKNRVENRKTGPNSYWHHAQPADGNILRIFFEKLAGKAIKTGQNILPGTWVKIKIDGSAQARLQETSDTHNVRAKRERAFR